MFSRFRSSHRPPAFSSQRLDMLARLCKDQGMTTKLQGHQNTVLCLATTNHDGPRIISGTEGGEIGMWSLDGSGVQQMTVSDREDVTSLCCSKLKPDVIYAAVGNKVNCYDVRKLPNPVQGYDFNEEEINQICLNEKENYLASCDDSGQVKIINLQEKKVYKTLRKHTNICATVAFRPDRQWDLYTGGYDSKLIQWDYPRSRATCTIEMSDVGLADQQDGPYLINPPFVHSLAVSHSGRYVACGTENGLVQVFRPHKKSLEHVQALREHSQGVSQVYFPRFRENTLVSGGNDGMIMFWDLSSLSCKSATSNGLPTTSASHNNPDEGASASVNPLIFASINHGEKINWLTTGYRASQKFVVVADGTCDLTLHSFPE